MGNRGLLITVLLIVMIGMDVLVYKVKCDQNAAPSQPPPITQSDDGKFEPLPDPKTNPVPPPRPVEVVPQFVTVQKYRQSEADTVYGDIISHSKGAPFGDGSGRGTNAHETTHGINSEIRNANQQSGKKINGFYVLNGRGVVLEEPRIKMSNAVKFVPQNLRSYRWHLYMEQQIKSWNDTPTYICDEWVAYINGGASDVDDIKKGKFRGGWTDGVSGCCDFSIYTIALAMATKNDDPEYWKSYPQFRNFIIWELRFAQKTFLEGRVMDKLKWKKQDDLLLQFLESPEAAPMREFCRTELMGVWLDIDPKKIRDIDYTGTPQYEMDLVLPRMLREHVR